MDSNKAGQKVIRLTRQASGIANSVSDTGNFTHFYLTGRKKTRSVFDSVTTSLPALSAS
jgi:hypothetical protein